jgi:hypothetical protein
MGPNSRTLNNEKWINGMNKTWKRTDHSWKVSQNALCDKMHAIVHAWNYVILLDFNNKLCSGTELHVVVHAWNYVIMMDSNKKLCAGTKTHVDVSLLNCVICSKSVFVAELWCLQWINVRCRIVLSAANQCSLSNYGVCSKLAFAAELCCLQRIRCSLLNYGVYSKSGFPCWIVLFATNQVFATELWCLQQIRFSLPNCVVCSELVFVAEWWCLHWISFCCRMVITVSPVNQFTDNSVFQRICITTNSFH